MKTESYLFGLSGVAAAMALSPQDLRAGGWWIEAGPVWRVGMSFKLDSPPSYAQMTGLLGAAGAPSLAEIGPVNAYADRSYDNGYVKKDRNTGSSVYPNDPNTTWNWGGGQYGGGFLSFFKQGAIANGTAANGRSEDMLGTGLQVLAGLPLWQGEKWSVDLSLGFQGIWGGRASFDHPSLSQSTITDRYDVSGLNPADLIGYQGNYEGSLPSPFTPTPVIPNKPTNRLFTTAVDRVGFTVDQSLYQFSLGPQIGYSPTRCLQLKLRPTVSLNLMEVEARRTETFQQNTWVNQNNQQRLFLGLGATAGADVDLGKGFYTGVFGGYEWITEKMKVSVGPNTVAIEGSGFVVGAAIGKRF